jgi:methionyl-tRNA formyltransferase
MPLRLIFMGTPDFSVPTLQAILRHGHHIVAVYTPPPKRADRKMRERPSPVEQEARRLSIPVFTPASLRTPDALREFGEHGADAAVVVAYGLILPKAILDAPRFGCFNLHASLLPRWRGAAPIERAIIEGDAETGVMVMKMDVGLDTGDIVSEERVEITDSTTSGDLRRTLAEAGAELMARAMDDLDLKGDDLPRQEQGSVGESYASKITNDETRVDWAKPARQLLRLIHGLSPKPAAWCEMPIAGQAVRVRILRCELVDGEGPPGELLDNRLTIACGQGAIRVLELQRADRGPMRADAFLAGARLKPPLRLH